MSNKIVSDESLFPTLKDKVVVISGGANGIGASTVKYLHAAGANIVFGDFNTAAGEALSRSLNDPARATFVPTDVTSYTANVALFKTALHKHGRVDHAVACAGILEQGLWFDPELTVESVETQEPTVNVLDVNIKGTAYLARIATVFLRHGMQKGENKSITLVSSAAGFRESPGLPIYQASKHGVVGLMRGIRNVVWPRDGIRVNCICPAMTDTQMTAAIIGMFRSKNLAFNTPDQVGQMIVTAQATEDLNGKSIYVENGDGWEFEDGLLRTMPEWLGEGPTQRMLETLKEVGQGDPWKIK